MGSGIAQVSAAAGFEVIVRDLDDGLLARSRRTIQSSLDKFVEKGKLDAGARDAVLGRLRFTSALAQLADCDLIIEAVTEDLALKNQLWIELDRLCPPATLFASNTSSLTITAMARVTERPQRFLGLHFFNPVPLMPLVEVIRTIQTSQDTLAEATAFVRTLGKEPIATRDSAGFIVNLLLIPYLLDAVRAVERGVASVQDIDTGMKLGCGHPMGPLTLLDFVGLDTSLKVGEILYEEFREARYAPPPLLKRMVLAGWYGKKSGKGFYDYSVSPSGRVGTMKSVNRSPLTLFVLLCACRATTSRPSFLPLPTSPSAEVELEIPQATRALAERLAKDSVSLVLVKEADGFIDSGWLDAATLERTGKRPLGTDVVRVRGWVNPSKQFWSEVVLEATYRAMADPSRPERELDLALPPDHPLQRRLAESIRKLIEEFGDPEALKALAPKGVPAVKPDTGKVKKDSLAVKKDTTKVKRDTVPEAQLPLTVDR